MFANLKDAPFFDGLRSLFKGKQPEARRWIVLDVETSGLNPYSDRLLAIAAVALEVSPDFEGISIVIGDSYEAVLKQDLPSNKDNILIHHIGTQAQSEGRPPLEVLEEFRAWLGQSPLLAFHAPFDAGMINRAYLQLDLLTLPNDWIDIEPLAKIVGGNKKALGLDDWLHFFGIECAVRHQAAADTLATCELLLRLWAGIKNEAKSFYELKNLANLGHWLPQT